MTVTAPKDGAELVGLLRTAMDHRDGPFCTRYPRDKAPAAPPPVAEIAPVPYATWELLRHGQDVAILAVGTMVQPALAAAELLVAEGVDPTVVNCRFLKPHDEVMLATILASHRILVVVEEGTVANGFGAYLAGLLQAEHAATRVVPMGVADAMVDQAPRAVQLARQGLTGEGISHRVLALLHQESLGAR
jgi:1-deoxy-D-xylulose-5-phosphate synthase